MSLPFLGKSKGAQVVSTIEVVPDTLFFTAPRRCWLSVKLLMNGVQIGESKIEGFTPEEMEKLGGIVLSAVDRYQEALRNHGNL